MAKQRKWNKKEFDNDATGDDGDTMSFEEIGEALDISALEAKKIFNQAMRKLRIPNPDNRKLWEYDNISNNDTVSDMAGTAL